jgi:hypothetical protein
MATENQVCQRREGRQAEFSYRMKGDGIGSGRYGHGDSVMGSPRLVTDL